MKRRVLSELMVFCMLISLLPTFAVAEDEIQLDEERENTAALSSEFVIPPVTPSPEPTPSSEPTQSHEHVYVGETYSPPTCTEEGYVIYMCTCGASYSDNLEAALGHLPADVAEVPATIGQPGMTAGVMCQRCGAILEGCEAIPALEEPANPEIPEHEHVYAIEVTEPTCTEQGYTTCTCACGEKYITDYTEPLGHLWGKGENESEIRCMRCGISKESGEAPTGTTDVPEAVVSTGSCGDNLTWTLNGDGTLVISGTGPMYDYGYGYDHGDSPWYQSEQVRNLLVEEGVTSIGANSFYACIELSKITIPASMKTIGEYAFYSCSSLAALELPEGLTEVNPKAFESCNVTDVYYDGNEESQKKYLSQVLPNANWHYNGIETGWNQCGESVYWQYSSITQTLTIRGSGPMWDWQNSGQTPWAQYGEQISSIVFEPGLTSIGSYAFGWIKSISEITIPGSVTTIGKSAFQGCSGLKKVTIPESTVTIGSSAFYDCSGLKTAGPVGSGSDFEFGWKDTIPSNAFKSDTWLTKIIIPETVSSIGGSTFYGCSSLTDVVIPESVQNLSASCFAYCTGLKSVTIPGTVTNAIHDAFMGCDAEDVYYGGDEARRSIYFERILSNATWHYAEADDGWGLCGNHLYWRYDSTTRSLQIKGAGDMWDYFSDYRTYAAPWTSYTGKIVDVRMEPGVTGIGQQAFENCAKISAITIPEGVTKIGVAAFRGSSLKSISLPQSLLAIGGSAFSQCASLEAITIPQGVTEIDGWTFSSCTGLKKIAFSGGLNKIGGSSFDCCSSLTEVVIPEGVTEIGNLAFSQCSGLRSVSIPDTVTVIGEGAFRYCSVLSSISLPEGLQSIEPETFRMCALAKLAIPSSVSKIGDNAFSGCGKLKAIYFQKKPPDIAQTSFAGVTANAYYPEDGDWWETDRINYGGTLTWVADHAWGEPVWTWQGTDSASATFTCKNDSSHVETVTATGKNITKSAVAEGEAYTATITFNGKTWTDTKTVPVTLKIEPAEMTLVFGESKKITVTGVPETGAVQWESSAPGVVEASEAGLVSARQVGTATITARVGSSTSSCDVRVLFTDVADASQFYFPFVYEMTDRGIVTGWDDGTFRPDNYCNRAAVVTFLWRLAGRPEPGAMARFSDMTGNEEFNKAISWAAEQGITTGWSDNTFRPWDTCNRAAIVTFLWRFAGKPNPGSMATFNDMTGNSDFDKAISWAAEKGITTGWSDNTFRPWNTCLRLAVVSFLSRYDAL